MELLDINLKERIEEVRYRIRDAALRAGRNPEEITLIGVTKNVGAEFVRKAAEFGIADFGENKVQEFLKKREEIPNVNWHYIGRLQTNKVKHLVGNVELIHSIDRLKLAEEIDKAALKENTVVNVLVQVNVSGEASKAGIDPSLCEEFMVEMSGFSNLRVKGLMTIAPLTHNKEEIKRIFANINKLFIDIGRKKIHNINMEYLSAGMTNDFETAIEEGANMIRVGTGIFGDIVSCNDFTN